MKNIVLLVTGLLLMTETFSQMRDTLYLWPGEVPGESEPKHAPVITGDTSGQTTRLTDITNPTLVVFEPEQHVHNGQGIIVCPGGGYKILSIDKEGNEIAGWLNSLGYTAFVLQYRVPDKQTGALQDIQRAIRMVKGNAQQWGIDSAHIGLIGFSAGASLSARASTHYTTNAYTPVDEWDSLSSRPAYALLIYPAYLDLGENRSLTPELKVNENTPPMFLFATADDNYANSALVMTTALRDAGVPVELHMLPFGGHGYGLRKGNQAAEAWPVWAENWLKSIVKQELVSR